MTIGDIFVLALLALVAYWVFKHWTLVKSWFAKSGDASATPADPPAPSASDDNSAPPGNAPPAA